MPATRANAIAVAPLSPAKNSLVKPASSLCRYEYQPWKCKLLGTSDPLTSAQSIPNKLTGLKHP